ncbi:profilin [Trichomonascus vanleenenianus]|uniref:profilin n=1 Tax=Trichomonascus vanleenenianus TaxID=2268995 RepID=UPI003ECA81AC
MSWQAYVDNLVGSGAIDKAALFSSTGDSVWAQTPGFNVSAAEVSEILSGYKDISGLQEKGLHVEGEKYFLLRNDDRSIYGKKDKTGVVIVKTKQALLVAHYDEARGTTAGQATQVVEKLGDYLVSTGF